MTTDTNLSQATAQFASALLREAWVKKGHIVMFFVGFIVGVAKERDNLLSVIVTILLISFLILVFWIFLGWLNGVTDDQ